MGRHGLRRRAAAAVLGCALAVAAGGCAEPFDRDATVQRVQAAPGQTLDRTQAECVVDRAVAELGEDVLAEGATRTDEEEVRLTAIRVDCVGLGALGTDGTSLDGLTADLVGPRVRGDDPVLDGLWDQCEATGAAACDALFDQAIAGSEYEAFALTCGGRTSRPNCAAHYGSTTTTTTGVSVAPAAPDPAATPPASGEVPTPAAPPG